MIARMKLSGDAGLWWRGMSPHIATWRDIEAHFRQRFAVPRETLYQRLNACTQSPGETVKHFADRFRSLCDRLALDTTGNATLYRFLHGLSPHIVESLYIMRPRSFAEAVAAACYLDEADACRAAQPRARAHT